MSIKVVTAAILLALIGLGVALAWVIRENIQVRNLLSVELKRSAQFQAENVAVDAKNQQLLTEVRKLREEMEATRMELESKVRDLQVKALTALQALRGSRARLPIAVPVLVTTDGRAYDNAKIVAIEAERIRVEHADGGGYVALDRLPPDLLRGLGLDALMARRETKAQGTSFVQKQPPASVLANPSAIPPPPPVIPEREAGEETAMPEVPDLSVDSLPPPEAKPGEELPAPEPAPSSAPAPEASLPSPTEPKQNSESGGDDPLPMP
jgi:cell division protein FtsB